MTFLTNLTLWKKITFLTTLGLILLVAVFSSLGMRAVNQATETMLQDRLTTAGLLAGYIDEALSRALSELKQTAENIVDNGERNGFEPLIYELEDTYSRLSLYTQGIYLFDEEEQIVWSKPHQSDIENINLISNASLSQVVIGDEAGISGLVSMPMTDTPVILLSSPTGAGLLEDHGTLVIAIDPAQSSIGGFIQPIRLGETGYIEIVDQNGIVVTRTEPGPRLAPFEQSDHSGRFAALITSGEPTRGVCHTCHEQEVERKDVLAFVPLSVTNWGVVVRQSENEALAPTRELRQNLILFGVALAIVALSFVFITTRDIGNRIRMLTAASKRMAEGDLISPVSTSGKDEVGILAQTLDDMRNKLNNSYGELEQKTKELSSLLSVSEILTSTFDLPKLLDAVVAKAIEVIPGADSGILLLQNSERDGLLVQSTVGLNKKVLSQFPLTIDNDFPSSSYSKPREKRKDLASFAINAFFKSEAMSSKAKSIVSAEVFNRNQYIGNLIMISLRDNHAFSESDHRLIQAIADYISIAIERAQLTKEAEEAHALHEADRLRSQFISSVSHELRTPLTIIKGYSTSLLRQNVSWDEQTQHEFLQTIDEKTDELRDLIDKILQSAKLEAGALKLEKEPVLLPQLARRVIEDTKLRVKKHGFVLEFAQSFPVIEADTRCIEQVLRNLVENAAKYSPENSEIRIKGDVKEREVLLSVSDKGEGIPAKHRDRIFERFYRVDNPLARGTSGSGLGLSIAKGHIEAHGGRIWLESTVGKGSKFYFSLPLDQVEDAQQKTKERITHEKKELNPIS